MPFERALQPLVVPAQVEQLDLVAAYVRLVAEAAQLDARAAYRLRLAVDELATNTITHGYAGAVGELSIRACLMRGRVTVTLEDSAPPFDPRDVAEPDDLDAPLEERSVGGLGLFLARRCASALEYERLPSGNRVTLRVECVCPWQSPSAVPRGRALVLFSEKDGLAALCVALVSEGYGVVVAASRDALLRPVDGAPPFELALLDTTGAVHVERLREAGTAVMLLVPQRTVDGQDPLDDEALLPAISLADDYLHLPIRPALLRARLSASFGVRGYQTRLRESVRSLKAAARIADDFTRVVLPLGVALAARGDPDDLYERIVEEARAVCRADGGTLYLRDGDTLRFTVVRTDSLGLRLGGRTGGPIPFTPLPLSHPDGTPNLHTVATFAAHTRETINIPDIEAATHFDFSGPRQFDAKMGYHTVSCLTTPLSDHEGDSIGVLQLINARDLDTGEIIPFDDYLEQVVRSIGGQAAIAVNNQILLRQREAWLRLEREMEIGRTLQLGFLPETLPDLPGWNLAAWCRPARDIGGDLYDVFELPAGDADADPPRLGLVVADVCDKGVGAAMFMGLIRSLIRAFARESAGETPAVLLQRGIGQINAYLVEAHHELAMFATVFYGVLTPTTGELCYLSAGHDLVWRLTADGVAPLPVTGPAVGIIAGAEFKIGSVKLGPGETLAAMTDGVVDARDPGGKRFGADALAAHIGGARNAEEVVGRVVTALHTHAAGAEAFDDVTVLVVHRELDNPTAS